MALLAPLIVMALENQMADNTIWYKRLTENYLFLNLLFNSLTGFLDLVHQFRVLILQRCSLYELLFMFTISYTCYMFKLGHFFLNYIGDDLIIRTRGSFKHWIYYWSAYVQEIIVFFCLHRWPRCWILLR